MEKEEHVVIVGGGIAGVSAAYYLMKEGDSGRESRLSVTLVEREAIACAASGKAGGFLAREWGNAVTDYLHHGGYDEYERLARELNLASYRKIPTLMISGGGKKRPTEGPSWLTRGRPIGPADTQTAQVDPKEVVDSMMKVAQDLGVKLIIDTVEDMVLGDENPKAVRGVKLASRGTLHCDKVLVAAGPWSGVLLRKVGFKLPMEGIRSTSIVVRSVREAAEEPYALFCADDSRGCHLEVYPRPSEEVYVCGCGGSDHVQEEDLAPGGACEKASQVSPRHHRAKAAFLSLKDSTTLVPAGQETPDIVQACLRPILPDALPAIGAVPGFANSLFVSTGMNCWGITFGPFAGRLIAQIILHRGKEKDHPSLRHLAADRFV
eukprot:CAMPEP_0119152518 /NCGR_PEP_ID=MMETSP1310-20130426/47925_1 /TAXON_ID=464262 /ORGANISM="Genus nov. species nov., Strain RCC2339" /LENGTH=377 /DNA_ID=CAMNT_0007144895 /DNA_START=60 /DNA_END=1193 /DNA_ORIENTATION=-